MLHLAPFKGWMPNANPHQIPVGSAQTQTNIGCIKPGQLDVRLGNRAVSFANTTTAVAKDGTSAGRLDHPAGTYFVYQLHSAVVKAGRVTVSS